MKPLVNVQLITNELSIHNNQLEPGTFNVNPICERNVGMIDEKHWFTQVVVKFENSEENPFPVDIVADMTGIFDVSNLPEDKIEDFAKHQAVQIILPYIRGMISSATANALMPPIVLPVVDVMQLFPD